MDDLAGKINAILNVPQAMQQVSALAGMLGQPEEGGPPPPEQQTSPGNLQGLSNLSNLGALSALLGGSPAAPQPQPPPDRPDSDMVQMLLRVMPLLNSMQQEDSGTRLLQSLRPLLSRERQKKLDEAARMMKLFRLLPLLQSRGMM